MKLKSYAKINLTLDILKKRADGYHELKTVYQHINLADCIELKESNEISIICNVKELENYDNICNKTALIMKEKFKINKGVKIIIDKKIPIGAGLSGGSSNAAAVLKGLNEFWGQSLKTEELIDIGKEIGMDVAFHLIGGTCLGEGRGEIIKKIKDFPKHYVVVVYPDFQLNTKTMYQNLNYSLIGKKKSSEIFMKNYDLGYIHNDFEYSVLKKYPEIGEIKEKLGDNSLLSGSGSCVYKITKDLREAENIYNQISKEYPDSFLTETIN
ncbi:MAG: 4-(cytidine 5'-diphospho)-2-C-methyl-D-erythritol kinase [Spirochaetes bacterium]|nr:4-(cytidine 5'-diphospho)-2-C-methyl-D-erythritol kinase [Spirochaetota bacterium]